jgi:hypothetical protein
LDPVQEVEVVDLVLNLEKDLGFDELSWERKLVSEWERCLLHELLRLNPSIYEE